MIGLRFRVNICALFFLSTLLVQESAYSFEVHRKASEDNEVVKNKLFPKIGTSEASLPAMGMILNQSLVSSILIHGSLGYFIDETWGLHLEMTVSNNQDVSQRNCLENFYYDPFAVVDPDCALPSMEDEYSPLFDEDGNPNEVKYKHMMAIEIDVRGTADEHIVVMHDDTVDRTTNGSGEVAKMTLSELKDLDAGSWWSSEFKGEQIPTLEETFDAVKKHGTAETTLILEMKTLDPGSIRKICSGLTQRNLLSKTVGIGLIHQSVDVRRRFYEGFNPYLWHFVWRDYCHWRSLICYTCLVI